MNYKKKNASTDFTLKQKWKTVEGGMLRKEGSQSQDSRGSRPRILNNRKEMTIEHNVMISLVN
jgi:hypothetical protein